MQVVVTRCTPADKDFAFEVTEAAMRPYVELGFGPWDAADQRRRFDDVFDPATCQRIMVDGTATGIFVVEDRPAEIFLARIFLLPAFQRRGIGSILIKRLIERARDEGKPLRLRVLRVNSAARRLYERLGFRVTESTAVHDYMEYSAAAPSDVVTRFLEQFTAWAAAQPEIQAAAVVGSHARGSASPTSDVDLVILADDPERFLSNRAWVETFGTTPAVSREEYGNVTSLRVRFDGGFEVEFGFTTDRWAREPVDPGTQEVIAGGMRVLFERRAVLSRLT